MLMDISVSYYSSPGARDNNEDAVFMQECRNGLLAMVADGLGGHDKGEVASNMAVSSVSHQLVNRTPDKDDLVQAIIQANNDISHAQTNGNAMKTTIAAVWIGNGVGYAANVGDTRIYQFRNGRIVYQSVDHSVAQISVLVGELSPEDIRTSPDRNKLIRVLGNEAAPKVDCQKLTVECGDRFLLCSDGFWEPVEETAMILAAEGTSDAKTWLEKMKGIITRAQRRHQDNHTAVAIIISA